MTDEEIGAVAEELAKAGGTSWYPGRTKGALLRPVSERYRDRARLAIAALDRVRTGRAAEACVAQAHTLQGGEPSGGPDRVQAGTVVVYRPPGDQRAIACRVERIEDGRAYLAPVPRPDIGWVSLESLEPLEEMSHTKGE